MLVLVRKRDESILIGADIVVTVLGVEGDRVRVGIQAPREVSILRNELKEQVTTANRAAAQALTGAQNILPELRERLVKSRV